MWRISAERQDLRLARRGAGPRQGSGNPGGYSLYEGGQVRLTMIVEAEWNKRLGRGFNSRRLHHEHMTVSSVDVFLMGATWVRLGAVKTRLRLG
jgi:hypothetical protein